MQLQFNGISCITDATTLKFLMKEKELSEKNGIAVAVNNHVISKSRWEQCLLKENDVVLVITAAAGG